MPSGQAYLPTLDVLIVVEGSLFFHHGAKAVSKPGAPAGNLKKGPASAGSAKPLEDGDAAALRPGTCLNWQSLLLDWKNLATTPLLRPRRLVATTDAVLWSIPIQRFAEVTAKHPNFGLQVTPLLYYVPQHAAVDVDCVFFFTPAVTAAVLALVTATLTKPGGGGRGRGTLIKAASRNVT